MYYTSSYELAVHCVFGKQSHFAILCDTTLLKQYMPYSEVTASLLPSSFKNIMSTP